jgi:hypothetical protein
MLSLKPSKKPLKEGISMRKSLLAMAALMGVATLPAHAWRVNIDKDTFADITFATQVFGRNEGKRTTAATDHNATNFSIGLANITASGQVNKLVYFNINAESPAFRQGFVVRDAFIGMRFANEFRVQAGAMRVPFSRIALTSSYNYLIPTQAHRDVFTGLSITPTDALGVLNDSSRDAGVVVWGNVAGGMLKYYLGVSDGRYDRRGGFFGANRTKDSLAYTIRLQFTPTMLGFKGETGYTLADTYLGRQNVLTLGVGYRVVGAETTGRPHNYSKDAKMFTADLLYEQKFGNLIPNLQVGYIDARDVAYRYDHPNVHYGKATQIYAQAQLLYDQMVGFGKPALAIRFEQNENKDLRRFNTDNGQTTATAGEPRNTRLGVFVNYYIKGQDAKIAFGVDTANRNRASKGNDGKNFTDYTLYLQTRF